MTILSANVPVVRPRLLSPRYASWQEAIKDAVRDVDQLCRLLDLPTEVTTSMGMARQQFPLLVPRGFIARMRPGDPTDPLLRQVWPVAEETADAPGFFFDPVDDAAATLQPGLLQKYSGRALLVTTGACAVHCRYCFRRHFPYSASPQSLEAWRPALDHIARDESLQ